ncbi:type IX secretion system protein PorD [Tenacibaculum maritimum]|uniref:type IX secretion system protein PorD n=1 Tax=Tenacibaculum maritimum TaxID=107401 RepID=UPI003875F0E2
MRNYFLSIVLAMLSINLINAQELNALVTINADKIQSSNKQVYKTLEKSLTEFLNQTEWTKKKVKVQERINCAFNIIINSQTNNNFDASLQVQSTRPAYNSTYETPILNINDTDFSFTYNEFDPLIYNPTSFDSNLISTIVFYVYTIIGVDADTFALKGGEDYLKEAENVMLQAQQSGGAGWENVIGKQNRFSIIDNLLSAKYDPLRTIYYNYHIKGLDIFSEDEKEAKKNIQASVEQLESLYNISIGNLMIRMFLDAKSDEIVNIFSDGALGKNPQKMKQVLQKVSPTNRDKWQKIN